MREIFLTNDSGYTALVDDDDYGYLNQWKWHAHSNGKNLTYARRKYTDNFGKKTEIMMHQQLLNVPEGFEIDHIDHDSLNNCRSNLRICTHQQNCVNHR